MGILEVKLGEGSILAADLGRLIILVQNFGSAERKA
jgi:hypothetical protein